MSDREQRVQLACESNCGNQFNDCRSKLMELDWDGYYPEVDSDGCLTGNLISAEQPGYDVCDVSATGVSVHDTAMDAVIVAE